MSHDLLETPQLLDRSECKDTSCVKIYRNYWKKSQTSRKARFMPTRLFFIFSVIYSNLNKSYWTLNFEKMSFVIKVPFLSEDYLGHYSKKVHQQEGVFAVLIVLWASSMNAWLENEKLFSCQFSVTICCVSPEYWLQRGVLDLLDTSERKYF